jgi:hypothetical protein
MTRKDRPNPWNVLDVCKIDTEQMGRDAPLPNGISAKPVPTKSAPLQYVALYQEILALFLQSH